MAYKYTLSNRSMMIIEEFNTEPNSHESIHRYANLNSLLPRDVAS